MNVNELSKWSESEAKKTNANLTELMTLIKEENRMSKITKVRAYLRGINECSNLVIANNKKSEQLNRTIEGYVSELTKIGVIKGVDRKPDDLKR